MPAYRFSWDPFDDRTVLDLARDIGSLVQCDVMDNTVLINSLMRIGRWVAENGMEGDASTHHRVTETHRGGEDHSATSADLSRDLDKLKFVGPPPAIAGGTDKAVAFQGSIPSAM
jgi:hypothetical protein